MENIEQVIIGCSGSAWKGFVCDETLFPQIVRDTTSMGDLFSLIMIIFALVLCAFFWICSFRIERDLTKSFLMPVAAPLSLLLPFELIHSVSIFTGRAENNQLISTLIEVEKYLNQVAHFTIVFSTAVYLLHSSAAARGGSFTGYEIDKNYSYSATYVVILLVYTISCACMLPIFPPKFTEFISIVLFGSALMAYAGLVMLFFCAMLVFCICSRPPVEQGNYPGYSKLGGALLFTQFALAGPMIRGFVLIPFDPVFIGFCKNIYLFLRFLLPFTVFFCTFLFLPTYREAFGYMCSPSICRAPENNGPDHGPINQIHRPTDPLPRTYTDLEAVQNQNHYQARVENVAV